ncbi:hypothetical protein [Streptomyces sp. NPDC015350]|uniref:hypothetical protein n=1 Tax=Streptomyces sp. NPDC015350 TaxID=3364955 RepID=UPI0036FCF5B8
MHSSERPAPAAVSVTRSRLREIGVSPFRARWLAENGQRAADGAVISSPGPLHKPLACADGADQLIKLYESGMSLRETGRQCGISTSTARKQLLAAGVTMRPGAPHRQVDVPKLIKLYESGMSLREAGRQCGISRSTVQKHLLAAGVTIRPVGPPHRQVDVPKLIKLYESGMPLEEAGRQCGISTSTVQKHLLAAGVTIRPGGPPRKQVDVPKLIKLYESGMPLEEAGRQCGISTSTAWKHLLAAGVTIRPVGPPRKQVDVPKLIKLYESGMPLEKAGRQCGISTSTARNRINAAHVGAIAPETPLPSSVAAFLYRKGYTPQQIKQLTGRSEKITRLIIEKEKSKELAKMNLLGVDLEKVTAAYRAVASVSATAEVLKLNRNVVRAGLRVAGTGLLDAPDPEAAPIHFPEQTRWQWQDQKILALAARHRTISEIASEMQVPIATVAHVIRVYSHRDRTKAEILRRRECGESEGVIALRMGLRLDRVIGVLTRHT